MLCIEILLHCGSEGSAPSLKSLWYSAAPCYSAAVIQCHRKAPWPEMDVHIAAAHPNSAALARAIALSLDTSSTLDVSSSRELSEWKAQPATRVFQCTRQMFASECKHCLNEGVRTGKGRYCTVYPADAEPSQDALSMD